MQKPLYSLQELQEIIRSGNEERVVFSVPNKSIRAVKAWFALIKNRDVFEFEARDFIFEGLLALSPDNFVERASLWSGSAFADVYGSIHSGAPWYVKFLIETDCDDIDDEIKETNAAKMEPGSEVRLLNEISFHPPELSMKTISGLVIPKGEIIYDQKMWKLRL